MHDIANIKHIHLEISSRCNARCPLCPRNLNGYPYNDGYIEHDMSIDEAKKIFPASFIKQLTGLLINGNFGDIVMNQDSIKIIEYFRANSPDIRIQISTNGGARDSSFWQDLARLKCEIWFCVDGLEDTNHLYRQNVVWNTVMKNAQTFIDAGGHATWQMIDFDFNQHQQQEAQNLAKKLGFTKFHIIREGRQDSPVFDKNGKLIHVIGNPPMTNFQKILWHRKNDQVLLEDIKLSPVSHIACKSVIGSSIFVSSTGDVYPCCFTGFSPREYGHGNYMQVINSQLKKIIGKNNALENDLEDCIEWFSHIKESWKDPDFNKTRLVVCQDKCGTNWRNNTYKQL